MASSSCVMIAIAVVSFLASGVQTAGEGTPCLVWQDEDGDFLANATCPLDRPHRATVIMDVNATHVTWTMEQSVTECITDTTCQDVKLSLTLMNVTTDRGELLLEWTVTWSKNPVPAVGPVKMRNQDLQDQKMPENAVMDLVYKEPMVKLRVAVSRRIPVTSKRTVDYGSMIWLVFLTSEARLDNGRDNSSVSGGYALPFPGQEAFMQPVTTDLLAPTSGTTSAANGTRWLTIISAIILVIAMSHVSPIRYV